MFKFFRREYLPLALSAYLASSYTQRILPCQRVVLFVLLSLRMQYQSAGGTLVCVLAGDLECNIVGGVALDLKSCCRQVVEVLVEQLEEILAGARHIVAKALELNLRRLRAWRYR